MPHKTLDVLAAEMPDTAMAVGELESVITGLNNILQNPDADVGEGVRSSLLACIAGIEARISKLDESGRARAWRAAWKEAEEAGA